jgi:hypothetical protein
VKRIHHPFYRWEEINAGMWSDDPAADRAELLQRAIELACDAQRFGQYMRRVTFEWPTSCQHNLSDLGQNRIAWLGQAAICLALQCPEHITRKAWGKLTVTQRAAANQQASRVIREWKYAITNRNLSGPMESQGLPGWDSRHRAGAPRTSEPRPIVSCHLPGHTDQRYSTRQPWLFPAEVRGLFHTETD